MRSSTPFDKRMITQTSFEMLTLPPSFYLRQNVSVTQAPCTFLSAPTKKHISVCLLSSILFSCLPLLYVCKVVSNLLSHYSDLLLTSFTEERKEGKLAALYFPVPATVNTAELVILFHCV